MQYALTLTFKYAKMRKCKIYIAVKPSVYGGDD